jgi:hypothetical protein
VRLLLHVACHLLLLVVPVWHQLMWLSRVTRHLLLSHHQQQLQLVPQLLFLELLTSPRLPLTLVLHLLLVALLLLQPQ